MFSTYDVRNRKMPGHKLYDYLERNDSRWWQTFMHVSTSQDESGSVNYGFYIISWQQCAPARQRQPNRSKEC